MFIFLLHCCRNFAEHFLKSSHRDGVDAGYQVACCMGFYELRRYVNSHPEAGRRQEGLSSGLLESVLAHWKPWRGPKDLRQAHITSELLPLPHGTVDHGLVFSPQSPWILNRIRDKPIYEGDSYQKLRKKGYGEKVKQIHSVWCGCNMEPEQEGQLERDSGVGRYNRVKGRPLVLWQTFP